MEHFKRASLDARQVPHLVVGVSEVVRVRVVGARDYVAVYIRFQIEPGRIEGAVVGQGRVDRYRPGTPGRVEPGRVRVEGDGVPGLRGAQLIRGDPVSAGGIIQPRRRE